MRTRNSLLLLGLAACAPAPDRAPTPKSVPNPAAAVTPVASSPPSVSNPSLWQLRGDSMMTWLLAGHLFLATGADTSEVRECSGDEGSDEPPLEAAVVAGRIVGRTPASLDSTSEYPYLIIRSTYHVEVTSVAIFIPQWIAKLPADSLVAGDIYEGIIAPRVDTFAINLGEYVPARPRDLDYPPVPPGARWTECAPTGPAVPASDGPGFWSFAHAADRWIQVRKWTPTDGSWARLTAMADSATRARRAP